jgi:formiminotetrahydrofolate cyclodeaminase
LATIGNPNLQSDVQAGLGLSYAAMQAAAANVRANLPFLAEADASRVRSALQDLLRDSDEVG